MKINKKTARALYQEDTPKWFKERLENKFSKEDLNFFDFKSIKTFEDVRKRIGTSVPGPNFEFNYDTTDINAYKKLKIITKAINDGWIPDFGNSHQSKWFPVFYYSSVTGLEYTTAYSAASSLDAFIGSRLCFESKEKADYAGKEFLDLYKRFLI